MEIYIDFEDSDCQDNPEENDCKLGAFRDLLAWIDEFNSAWEGKMKYLLEPVATDKSDADVFLFYEYDSEKNEYEVGTIFKVGDEAFAKSPAVHELVMNAFLRFCDNFRDRMVA